MFHHQPLIIGHRGAARYLPENTLESFELALVDLQTDMIEFDVHFSKDEVCVILHDATLERTSNAKGFVSARAFADLKKYDFACQFERRSDNPYAVRLKTMALPSLDQVFQKFSNHELCIEIKDNSAELTHAVVALAKKYKVTDHLIIGSKHETVSQTMKKYYPEIYRFLSSSEIILNYLAYKSPVKHNGQDSKAVASMPLERCGFHFDEKGFIDFLHQKGVRVFYWTINDAETMQALAKNGADGIITDDPILANKVFSRPGGTDPKDV